MRLFSQMSRDELIEEISLLEKELAKAEKMGRKSEANILRQRRNMARSYLVDPHIIQPGATYKVEGAEKTFQVEYLKGIMAWGKWEGSQELVAIPIALIQQDT